MQRMLFIDPRLNLRVQLAVHTVSRCMGLLQVSTQFKLMTSSGFIVASRSCLSTNLCQARFYKITIYLLSLN
uniref:Uncharacterized protein n=1 Tax=Solanum lycopersicum TaxID=4081 RepID=A0A3Q7GZT3_SOLLC